MSPSTGSAPSEASKYPPTEFSLKYAKVLAPNGKLVSPDQVFGEGGMFDKDAEENKELLKLAKLDQIVECFPNTLLKMLPGEISKTKWSKKAKEVLSWEDWWEMHEKIVQPLEQQAESISSWWEYTGKPNPGVPESSTASR